MRINGIPDAGLAALQRMMAAALPRAAARVLPVEVPAPASPPVALAQPHASIEMLVAIAAADPEARRRRAAASAENGLGVLERLSEAERLGRPAPVDELSAWMANHDLPDDVAARRILLEVELRVLVELARREQPEPGC